MLNNILIEEVPITTKINQGGSLSLLLFKIVIGIIIEKVKNVERVFRIDKGELNIISYVGHEVIKAENEDNLHTIELTTN